MAHMKTSFLLLTAALLWLVPSISAAQPSDDDAAALPPVRLICHARLDVAQTVAIARPLLGRDGLLVADRQTNCLLVVDSAPRVDRLRALFAALEERATLSAPRPRRGAPSPTRGSRSP